MVLSAVLMVGCAAQPSALFRRGIDLLNRSEYASAEAQMRALIEGCERLPLSEDDAQAVASAYYVLGQALQGQGKHDAARRVFEDCLVRHGDNACSCLSLFGLVDVQVRAGDVELAANLLKEYAAKARNRYAAKEALGLVLGWPLLTATSTQSQDRARLWTLIFSRVSSDEAGVMTQADALIKLNPQGKYAQFARIVLSQIEP
jgi:tetratricopeptide (TPR) repeat protein